jgi:hypothetical protein
LQGLKKADIPKELRQMAKLVGAVASAGVSAPGSSAATRPAGGLYD